MVVTRHRRRYPWTVRMYAAPSDELGHLASETAARAFVRSHPFVALHPANTGAWRALVQVVR